MVSLPRGRHGLTREFIAEHQRGRIFAAVPAVLDRYGYDGTTVAAVATEAGVSKSDFYAQFESKDDCFLAAYDAAVQRLRTRVLASCEGVEDWAGRVCACLAAVLAHLAAEPAQANLLLVEGLRAGPVVYCRFQSGVESFVPYFRAGAPLAGGAVRPPPSVEEAVVGGVASLLARRVLAGEADRLELFFPELAEFALSPYLGAPEARRIASA